MGKTAKSVILKYICGLSKRLKWKKEVINKLQNWTGQPGMYNLYLILFHIKVLCE